MTRLALLDRIRARIPSMMSIHEPSNSTGPSEHDWLEALLIGQIPMAEAMGLTLAELSPDGIRLAFPLGPNINDKGTAFGGAMSSAMILAGWSLPRLLLKRAGVSSDLVIGRCEIRFKAPVDGPFNAWCSWPAQDACEQFLEAVRSGRKARLALQPEIHHDQQVAAVLEAVYTALPTQAGGKQVAPSTTPAR